MSSFIELSDTNRYDNKRNVWVKAKMLLSKFDLENIASRWICIGTITPTDDEKENNRKMFSLFRSINKKG